MDRESFLKWVEKDVLQALAINGRRVGGEAHYRKVKAAENQDLAVDVLENGLMRVHLFSTDEKHKTSWRNLSQQLASNKHPASLPALPQGPLPKFRDNGLRKRAYFRFEWKRGSDSLQSERETVRNYVSWLRRVAQRPW